MPTRNSSDIIIFVAKRKIMKRFCYGIVCIIVVSLLSSCATASLSKYKGIGRVKSYDFYSADLPDEFDGFRVAFATDFHYESRFSTKRLPGLVKALRAAAADILLLGGDYRGRHGGNMDELFQAICQIDYPMGIYAVMGNHESGENGRLVREALDKYGVTLLEHRLDTLKRGDARLILCGIRDPFNLKKNGVSPTLQLKQDDFVLLMTHTPDYVEDVDVTNTDLAFAGHTHGGQVSLFKRWTPAKHFSKYGNRFLTGLRHNSAGIPIIISNGIGTSRKDIRLFTPSEIVVVVLRKAD